ncbi:MBOAT family O-acyltransferase [Butyrivibrio sp. MC2013]|uniref:MBOAT family O-acyltransferase n=1 Tax=Butyrivibrio sp. MC2013 TaxID=1280686 RepID=UPI0004030E8B|nr:MBOAT family O-acyltransferase [Butyrivibrio sp. MC2013]
MELYSLLFFVFIAVLMALYYLVPSDHRYQNALLLIGSLAFYAYHGVFNLIFILVTSLSVWMGALLMDRLSASYGARRKAETDKSVKREIKAEMTRRRRAVLFAVLILNFGILAYLKYWNVLFHTSGLLFPLGISFYTFQATGYLIDQYNNKYPAEKDYLRFLLFVSFFPQLIQGPIGRYDQLGVQFGSRRSIDYESFKRCLLLAGFGFMKKYAVANLLSDSISIVLDGNIASLSGSTIFTAVLMYSAQQYADFSGGIDIVTAVSGMLGIRLMVNFRQPYFSVSLGDFWRRWHISLGTWMRDYVFYPFALLKFMQRFGKWCGKRLGSHAGRVIPAGIANILVFFLVGIWHGAELHYIAWGLYNGIIIALSDLAEPFFKNVNDRLHISPLSRGMYIFRIIRTFLIVNIGWYFDRIYDIGDAFMALGRTFTSFNLRSLTFEIGNTMLNPDLVSPAYVLGGFALAVIGCLVIFAVSILRERNVDVYLFIRSRAFPVRFALYQGLIFLILASFMLATSAGGFMYANF